MIGLTDANGNLVNSYRYDPYGKRLAATEAVPNPFQFHAGATFTGGTTYKYGTRWYDTTTGTWTQLDPTGADPGYTYTGGDPANRTDPSGRWFWDDWGNGENFGDEVWPDDLEEFGGRVLAGVGIGVGVGFAVGAALAGFPVLIGGIAVSAEAIATGSGLLAGIAAASGVRGVRFGA